jgi:hypothetical protein
LKRHFQTSVMVDASFGNDEGFIIVHRLKLKAQR